MTVTQELLALILDRNATDEAALRRAEDAFVDTVAVLVAGAGEEAVPRLAAVVGETDGPSRSLATGAWMSARSAALIDATAAHALDYDDVDDAIIGHPSAVLVPALLAVGQDRDVDGAAVLAAYDVGLAAGRVVGRALDIPSHFAAGWHPTCTVGTIAAAAAGARLLDLDEHGVRNALGIAGSLAAGSRQNFGTMTKPLHAGMAASQGLTAAALAANGFTADAHQLDGPLGFLALHRAVDAPPATDSHLHPGLNVKRYPCCYATHSAIEATLDLRATLASAPHPEEVTRIEVAVHPGGMDPLIHHRPADGTEAKFSMEYAVAAALLDGRIGLASFADDRARRSDVQGLLRLVEPHEAALPADVEAFWFARVTVRLSDGTSATAQVGDPAGHATRPLSLDALREKFDDCFAGACGPAVGEAWAVLSGLRSQRSVREVVGTVVDARLKAAVPT